MKTARVLIVEDESIIALSLEESLTKMGYQVVDTAANANDAMRMAREYKPDIVLMDIRLQGEMDGIQTADAIGSESGIPVVFLTAHADDSYLDQALLTNPYGYLVKPAQENELRVTLKLALHAAATDHKRKEAEEKLENHKTMLQSVLDSIQGSARLLDKQGKFLYGNKATLEKFNLDSDMFLGLTPGNLLPPELSAKRMKVLSSVMDSGKTAKFQDSFDGRHFEHSVFPFYDAAGEMQGVTILSFDVTESVRKEEDLQTLWMAANHTTSSILITDREGIIEYVNPGFCEASGYSREEIIGKKPSILKSGEHDDKFYKSMWSAISSGQTWKGEICNRKKDGELFWEMESISPVVNEEGAVKFYIAVKDDITQKRAFERMKEDVERIMRHDLKTPLNAIIGFPNVLIKADNLTERQRDYCRLIASSGLRMLNMIDLYLSMIKMESGKYEFAPAPLDISAIIDTIHAELKEQADTKGVSLERKVLDEDLQSEKQIIVMGEKLLCYSALSNLIKNAYEASPDNQTVSTTIQRKASRILIQISNRGTVPLEIRSRFFEKYTTWGKSKGTGLGTYSARLMVETMKGAIEMATSDETGTVVSVHLPSV